MFAITQDKPGGPNTLRWEKAPDPTPGPNEVIIDIAASAVNRADLLQREGKYPPPPGASDVIGLECSGTIASVGAALTLDRIGERVGNKDRYMYWYHFFQGQIDLLKLATHRELYVNEINQAEKQGLQSSARSVSTTTRLEDRGPNP